ncbi:hypothetical protein CHS0354_018736 [Potamilus streckersoni]|uniref:non-specific serine/threonine protein kinase n=1 Tax=Potamilus streckersoni TaxID=2493646 RepID=A0AAE0T310_9BIVA|nr:hypothetical protein CHS0354_018736 [Potamilus streckersoni]
MIGSKDQSRRPLVIGGDSRHMLQEIRNSLSHHLKKSSAEAGQDGPTTDMPATTQPALGPNLSQSTPNIFEKSGINGPEKRQKYHQKALEDIRNSLRPYQYTHSNTNSSTTSQGSDDGELERLVSQRSDEEILNQASKGSEPSKKTEMALQLIEKFDKQLNARNGVIKTVVSKTRKGSFGTGSPDSSIRSDSPGVSSIHGRQPQFNDPSWNVTRITPSPDGTQTPPPVPPRAPIVSTIVNTTQNTQAVLKNVTPSGHQPVASPQTTSLQSTHQSFSQRMSPSPGDPRKQAMNYTSPLVQMIPQRGVSPVSVARQQVIIKSTCNPISQPYIGGTPGNVNGQSSSGPRVTIKYTPPPPPYSPRVISSQVLTDYTLQVPNKETPTNMKHSDDESVSVSYNKIVTNKNTHKSPQPVYAWGAKQPPIIMQQVRSQKVRKPELQTAMPVVPLQNSDTSHSYISFLEANVNSPPQAAAQQQLPKQNSKGSVQIKIKTRSPSQNGSPHRAPEQINMPHGYRPTIQINIGNQNSQGHQIAYLQNFPSVLKNNHDCCQGSASGTPTSTPRSDSPVSRATNHSPLSVLSTTSTPSTNSDIPDRPPPPYPGRPFTQSHLANLQPGHPVQIVQPIPQQPISQVQSQRQSLQPPLPPRAPITQVRPPPVPPPISEESEEPPPLPPPKNVKSPQSLPPPSSPTSHTNQNNGDQVMAKSEQQNTEETDTETLSTVSDTSVTQEKHRCTSPIPERRPEAKEKDKLRRDTLVRNYSPQAFKFFMEQHVENLMKCHKDRMHRRIQLENEMQKVGLSDEAQHQMRRMLSQKESNYIRLRRAKMDKSMFDKIQRLGIGAFGEVALVRKKDVHQLYAMKTLRKSDVLKRNQVAHVKAERDILAEADNEWVVKLYYSFQDQENLYFVMDYVPGGDLMGLLIKFGIFEENLARFYIAELVLAIESVHKMGFIHRDIKPDNILIDKDGHIKLTDFGLCTGFRWTHNSRYYQQEGSHARQDSMEVSCMTNNPPEECNCTRFKTLERRKHRDRQRCLAHSLVGTPNYIAPEVLLRQGYTSCCDWWSVGVILYEMLVGQPPFYAATPQETQFKVIHWEKTLKIPPEANVSEPATDLIMRLCCAAENRLGKEGALEIKKHQFFSAIQFDGLRRQTALYIPQIRHAMDTSNFDPIDPEKFNDESDDEMKKLDHPENGKYPEHAFIEFTFRRFFDDGGHPYPMRDSDSTTTTSPVYV